MKLDKFFDKRPNTRRQTSSPVVVQNEYKIGQLETKIAELEQQVVDQNNLRSERDSAVNRQMAVEEQRRELQIELDRLNETVNLRNADIEEYEKRVQEIPLLQESVKSETAKASTLQNDLMNSMQHVAKLSNDLENATKQVIGLTDENTALHKSEGKAVSDQISLADEFKDLKNQFERIKTFSDQNSKIKQDLEKEVFELRDNRNYWHKEAEEAKIQVEQTAIIEDRLRNWITQLEKDETSSRKKSSAAVSIVAELKTTITGMGETIEELMKERNYLQQVNAEYRKELAQPRYMSMGSIMARENFSMPLARENIRTQYLGNSSPTLLKFKKKSGESNDN